MNIKSSQTLVEEAKKKITTLNAKEAKKLHEKGEIKFIDVRDIRELWKEGTIKNSVHIPRGMLEFWLDPESSYYKEKNEHLFISAPTAVFHRDKCYDNRLKCKFVDFEEI